MRALLAKWRVAAGMLLCVLFFSLGGCGVNTPGEMDWVQPHTKAKRVGTVYLIRGWMGVFSSGIDKMAGEINEAGGTAYVFQDMQWKELGAELVKKYKGVKDPEPICFIGHSRGVDASLIIARDLEKIGVPVELIVSLDSVDETLVAKNVHICYNYWMPGFFPGTNILRGIPLVQEKGATGKLYNINLNIDAPELKDPGTWHAVIDKAPKIQKKIVEHVMEACPERSSWRPENLWRPPS